MIITVDVEIFGNGDGSVESCIIEPGRMILHRLNQAEVKGVFFIEVLHLSILFTHDREAYDSIVSFLMDVLISEHKFGLHVHPQWLEYEVLSGQLVPRGVDSTEVSNSLDCYTMYNKTQAAIDLLAKNGMDFNFEYFRAGGLMSPRDAKFYSDFSSLFGITKFSNFTRCSSLFGCLDTKAPKELDWNEIHLISVKVSSFVRLFSSFYRRFVIKQKSNRTFSVKPTCSVSQTLPISTQNKTIDYMDVCPILLPFLIKKEAQRMCEGKMLLMHTKNFFGGKSFYFFLKLSHLLRLLK